MSYTYNYHANVYKIKRHGVNECGSNDGKCSAVAEMGDRLATINIGGCVPYGGSSIPCNTMWSGPRPTFVPSGTLIYTAVWPQQTWAENWGRALTLRGEVEMVRIKHNVVRAEHTFVPTGILNHPNRLATTYMGRKWGGSVPPPFWVGSWVPI